MEPFFLGVVSLAALGYGTYKLGRKGFQIATVAVEKYRRAARDAAAERQWNIARERDERERLHRQSVLARQLQIALFHLDAAPDFRRPASWAQKAQEVPLAFRQRQFRRFRTRMVQHFATRLRAGTDPTILSESLTELLRCLGISAFEAEYIRTAAEGKIHTPVSVPPSYDQQLLVIHREHERRVAAIQGLATSPADIREQLLEAEQNRYREALLQLGEQ